MKNKIIIIHNGVDNTFLDISRNSVPPASGNILRITTIAHLIPRKGIGQIISALSQLPDIKNIILTIVGDGPERKNLVELVDKYHLGENVIFKGSISPDNIPSILSNSDIFILSSYSEGRPNAVLEAMASGLPVIATDIEGTIELVKNGETGLLFKAGDINQLSQHIMFLKNNPSIMHKYGAAGRKFIIENNLTWDASAQQYLSAYNALLNNFK